MNKKKNQRVIIKSNKNYELIMAELVTQIINLEDRLDVLEAQVSLTNKFKNENLPSIKLNMEQLNLDNEFDRFLG